MCRALVSLLLLPLSLAVAKETVLVPTIPEAVVAKDKAFIEQEALPFYRKHLVESFTPGNLKPEVARRVLAVREAVAQWYARTAETMYFDPFFFPAPMMEEAERLIKEKCDDPAVWLASTIGRDEAFRIRTGVERLAKAHGRATGILRLLCAHQGRCMRSWARQDLNKKHGAWLREDVKACQAELQAAPPRVVLRLFLPDHCYPLFCDPGYDPALRACLDAAHWAKDAFKARGEGLASSVTKEGWDGWNTNLDRARLAAKLATRLRPEWSEAWMLRSSYALRSCGSDAKGLAWQSKALATSSLAAEQLERTLHYCTSRWGGSTQLLTDFVDAFLTARADTLVPYRGLRTTLRKRDLFERLGPREARYRELFTPLRRSAIYALAEDYLSQPPSPLLPDDRNVFAVMAMTIAMECEDWAMLEQFRRRFKPPVAESAFDFPNTVISIALNPARTNFLRALATTTYPEQFLEAERALSAGDFTGATARYEALLKQGKGLGNRGRDTIEGRLFAIRAREVGESAGFVSLMPTAGGGETAEDFPRLVTRPDGLAQLKGNRGGASNPAFLVKTVGQRVEARIHFLPAPKQKRQEIGWGLSQHVFRLRFVREASGDRWELMQLTNNDIRPVRAFPLERSDTHTFAFERTGLTTARIFVDGRLADLPEDFPLNNDEMRYNLSNGWGEPTPLHWQLSPNTAFDRYGIRPIPDEKAQ